MRYTLNDAGTFSNKKQTIKQQNNNNNSYTNNNSNDINSNNSNDNMADPQSWACGPTLTYMHQR